MLVLSPIWIIVAGLSFGLGAVFLVKMGNPGNYGFCAACHLRDISGALGIHRVETLQYTRPEILGWIIGAFAVAKTNGEFRARGGSSPLLRFMLGAMMMFGALVFLGCPLRSILRLAGGDLNGLTGLAGFVAGISIGIVFLKKGFTLGRAHVVKSSAAYAGYLPFAFASFLAVAVAFGAGFLYFSSKGPGSLHAPVFISLVAGLVTGGIAMKTRMCLSGGFRDFLLVRDTFLLKTYGLIFLSAVVANLALGSFKPGFDGQPLAHTMHIWNFLSMLLVGVSATLLGGCPLRQLIMAAEGNLDAGVCVLGMMAGAGLAHTFNLAASAAGVSPAGQIAVVGAICLVIGLGWFSREKINTAATA